MPVTEVKAPLLIEYSPLIILMGAEVLMSLTVMALEITSVLRARLLCWVNVNSAG